jgi:preprotein translocase subunit SecG
VLQDAVVDFVGLRSRVNVRRLFSSAQVPSALLRTISVSSIGHCIGCVGVSWLNKKTKKKNRSSNFRDQPELQNPIIFVNALDATR